MLTSEEAAQIFQRWALDEGLSTDHLDIQSPVTAAGASLIDPITDKGIQLLRSKQIQCVGFNQKSNEIQVFLKRSAPTTKKQLKILPATVDGVRIVYQQGVQNPVGQSPSVPFGQPPYTMRQTANRKYLTCGSSISVGNNRDAGTLGCLVTDSAGSIYGLSNNHVSGSCSFAGVNLPIVAPGIFDVSPGGLDPFTLGFHYKALRLVAGAPGNVNHQENLDAAIFKLADITSVSSFQGAAYDTPSDCLALTAGMQVEKVGRTTGHTKGIVMSRISGAHPINYSAPLYGFSGQVYFEPVFAVVGQTEAFSSNGDSGSLVTTIDSNGVRFAVGIVVGGMNDSSAPGKIISIILPLAPILAEFGTKLVSGHNI